MMYNLNWTSGSSTLTRQNNSQSHDPLHRNEINHHQQDIPLHSYTGVIPCQFIKCSPHDPLRFVWKNSIEWVIFLVGYMQNFRFLLWILFAWKILKQSKKCTFLAPFLMALSEWPFSNWNNIKTICARSIKFTELKVLAKDTMISNYQFSDQFHNKMPALCFSFRKTTNKFSKGI